MFVDIHTHNAVDSGYPAVRNLSFEEAGRMVVSDRKEYFSVGFHPWNAGEFSTELMDKMIVWSKDSRFAAIGECGFDKNSKDSFEVQKEVLGYQIALSEKVHKPVIIHCVGYFNELFELKKKINPTQ